MFPYLYLHKKKWTLKESIWHLPAIYKITTHSKKNKNLTQSDKASPIAMLLFFHLFVIFLLLSFSFHYQPSARSKIFIEHLHVYHIYRHIHIKHIRASQKKVLCRAYNIHTYVIMCCISYENVKSTKVIYHLWIITMRKAFCWRIFRCTRYVRQTEEKTHTCTMKTEKIYTQLEKILAAQLVGVKLKECNISDERTWLSYGLLLKTVYVYISIYINQRHTYKHLFYKYHYGPFVGLKKNINLPLINYKTDQKNLFYGVFNIKMVFNDKKKHDCRYWFTALKVNGIEMSLYRRTRT